MTFYIEIGHSLEKPQYYNMETKMAYYQEFHNAHHLRSH